MKEQTIPISVVKEMLEGQREFTKTLLEQQNQMHIVQLQALGQHLETCAKLFERALNPPMPPQPEIPEHTNDMPRMSEEEEDWYFAYQNGDITKVQLDEKLKNYMTGSYAE